MKREDLERLTEAELDELICDCKADEAANLNNEGREAQIEYLLDEELPETGPLGGLLQKLEALPAWLGPGFTIIILVYWVVSGLAGNKNDEAIVALLRENGYSDISIPTPSTMEVMTNSGPVRAVTFTAEDTEGATVDGIVIPVVIPVTTKQ